MKGVKFLDVNGVLKGCKHPLSCRWGENGVANEVEIWVGCIMMKTDEKKKNMGGIKSVLIYSISDIKVSVMNLDQEKGVREH